MKQTSRAKQALEFLLRECAASRHHYEAIAKGDSATCACGRMTIRTPVVAASEEA